MPNPMVHIDFARRAAETLNHPVLTENLGYVALGSTSPDIRVITRQPREIYHFAALDFEDIGAGIKGMSDAYPELFDRSQHDEATQAFLAGYVSHLVMDETWIVEMFRPYFGNKEVFEDEVEGQVMDRALQLELDRQSKASAKEMAALIDDSRTGVEITFIPPDTLDEWCDWVIGMIHREFSMERLRFMASRIAQWEESHPAHAIVDDFLGSPSEGMDRLYERVPREHVTSFKSRAVGRLAETMADYMS